MLNYINPNAKAPAAVTIFTKPGCSFCAKAKAALKESNISFEEIILGTDATSVSLKAVTGQTTVPQIFVDGKHLGDSEAAIAYANS